MHYAVIICGKFVAIPSAEKDYPALMWHLTSLLFLVIEVSLAHLIEISQPVHAIQLENTVHRVAIAEKVMGQVFLRGRLSYFVPTRQEQIEHKLFQTA